MATCPKCTTEIDSLLCYQKTVWKLSPDGSNALQDMSMDWACPSCSEVLFSGRLEKEVEVVEWLAQ